MAAGATRAIDAVRRAAVQHAVHAYAVGDATGRERGARPAYGDEAAAALRVDPRRIHKTLVATVDGGLVVAVVAVAGEVDLKALAGALGGRRAAMADVAEAERATGYIRGGISPLGQRRSLPTVVDAAAMTWPTIYVSAGRRGLQLEMSPADLVHLTDARVAAIARRDGGQQDEP
jgi:Cys-tRNA(Pro)/Cys-tRNA(Cys) deacylase